jgi:hypothetical protein
MARQASFAEARIRELAVRLATASPEQVAEAIDVHPATLRRGHEEPSSIYGRLVEAVDAAGASRSVPLATPPWPRRIYGASARGARGRIGYVLNDEHACAASPTAGRSMPGLLEPVAPGSGPPRSSGPLLSVSPAVARSTSCSATTGARSSKARRRGSFAAFAAQLRPALVIYAHQHRHTQAPPGSPRSWGTAPSGTARPRPSCSTAPRQPGSARALRRRQAAAQPEAAAPAR